MSHEREHEHEQASLQLAPESEVQTRRTSMPASPSTAAELEPSERRIAALVLPELVRQVPAEELSSQLLELAEILRRQAMQVSIDLPDTIWLDITGIGHLHAPPESSAHDAPLAGERHLALALKELMEEQGHRVQLAVAAGPRIAQAVARYASLDGRGLRIVSSKDTKAVMAELPLLALLDLKKQVWFAKLGVLTIHDLLALPERSVSSRLGKGAPALLELARGVDRTPLTACQFPRELSQHLCWDEASVGIEPLLFALRGMTSRFEARLCGRGEALTRLSLELEHERSVCRHRGIFSKTLLEFELSSSLFRSFELLRVLRARLERTQLPAPTLALTLRGFGLCPQSPEQLQLGSRAAVSSLERLPVLLAELEADVGAENLGTLSVNDAHRPEERGRLQPLSEIRINTRGKHATNGKHAARGKHAADCSPSHKQSAPLDPLDRATRLLRHPVAIPVPLKQGEGFALGGSFYTIERLYFVERLELIQWWSKQSHSRDYLWTWLMSSHGGTEALIYVDRYTGRAFVQALLD